MTRCRQSRQGLTLAQLTNLAHEAALSSDMPPAKPPASSPAPFQPWPPSDPLMQVPGHPAHKVTPPTNGFYCWSFGDCTWWAQWKRQDQNLITIAEKRDWAYARDWADVAAIRGYKVGETPRVRATVVFQPGLDGVGDVGHVAHVEEVYPDGWF